MSERKKLKKKYEQTREEAKLLRSAAGEEGPPFMFPVRCAVHFSRPFSSSPTRCFIYAGSFGGREVRYFCVSPLLSASLTPPFFHVPCKRLAFAARAVHRLPTERPATAEHEARVA